VPLFPIFGLIIGFLLWRVGSWADQAHLSEDNIDQLGKLVDACLSDDAPNFGDARVAVGREVRADRWCVAAHAAELVNREWAALLADASLTKNRAAGAGRGDGDGSDDQDRTQDNEGDRGHDKVKSALQLGFTVRTKDFMTSAIRALADPTLGSSAPEGRFPARLSSTTPGSSASE